MVLTFQHSETIKAKGHQPQIVHMMDNSFRIIYCTDNGTVEGMLSYPPLGIYDELEWESVPRMSPDKGIAYPSLKKVAHHGAYGFWCALDESGVGIEHKFVMYMLPMDVSNMFISGNISYSNGSPVSSATFSFYNVDEKLLRRTRSPVAPNVILELNFTLGSSTPILLGKWHIDRVSTDIPGNTISVSARNTIGKLLKEQTFDENNVFSKDNFGENLAAILEYSGVEDFFVTENAKAWNLQFSPDTALLDGIEDVIQVVTGWKIYENANGVVGIGSSNDARFEQPSVFSFEREYDCYSYSTEYSDEDTYSRICVIREEPALSFYEELEPHPLWPVPPHRTLYVTVPNGTSEGMMHMYAYQLAQSVSISGRQETFAGRFSPQMIIGDSVRMTSNGETKIIGVVTSIKHTFGRKGFYTEFTVDSGGRRSRPMLKDYLSNISNERKSESIITGEQE